jgi:hypothetical protein
MNLCNYFVFKTTWTKKKKLQTGLENFLGYDACLGSIRKAESLKNNPFRSKTVSFGFLFLGTHSKLSQNRRKDTHVFRALDVF